MPGTPRATEITCYRVLSLLLVQGCAYGDGPAEPPSPCTDSWYTLVESVVPTGDDMGHGPDVGSAEWKSVVEFRLGIRGTARIPDPSSRAWCEYIDKCIK